MHIRVSTWEKDTWDSFFGSAGLYCLLFDRNLNLLEASENFCRLFSSDRPSFSDPALHLCLSALTRSARCIRVLHHGTPEEWTDVLDLPETGKAHYHIRAVRRKNNLLLGFSRLPILLNTPVSGNLRDKHTSEKLWEDLRLVINRDQEILEADRHFRSRIDSAPEGKLFEYVYPEDIPSLHLHLLRPSCDSTGDCTCTAAELRLISRSGHVAWYEMKSDCRQRKRNPEKIVLYFRNIAERRELYARLEESERRYRTIFESFQDIYYVTEQNRNEFYITDISPSVERISGYTPASVTGCKARDFFYESPEAKRLLDIIFSEGSVQDYPILLRHREGYPLWASISSQLAYENDKLVIRGVLKDITLQKVAEDRLRQREEFYRSLIENSLEITGIIDPKGSIKFLSPAVKTVMGYEPGNLLGKNVFDYIHPEDLEVARDSFFRRVKNGGIGRRLEWRFRHNDGHYAYLGVMINNLLDNEIVQGMILNAVDVTEKYVAELGLIRSNNRFKLLNDINTLILSSDSVKEIADRSLGLIVEDLLNCEHGSLSIFRQDQVEMVSSYVPRGRSSLKKGMKLPMTSFGSIPTLITGRSYLVEDIEALPLRSQTDEELWRDGIRAYVMFPLIAKGRLIGSLNFGSCTPGFFKGETVEFLGSVAGQVALGVQDAFLKEELVSSEIQKSAIIAGIPDQIFRIDKKGNFIDYHSIQEEDFYVPPPGFIGKNIRDMLPHNIGRKFLEYSGIALVSSELQLFEYEIEKTDGSRFYEARFSPTANNEVIVCVRDITSKINIIRELKLRNEAIETSPDGVFIVNAQSCRFTFVNKAFSTVTGFSEAEMQDKTFSFLPRTRKKDNWIFHLFRQNTDAEQIYKRLNYEGIYKGEMLSYRKDGTSFWNFFTIHALRERDRITHFVGMIRDITEMKNFERKVLHAVVDAQEAERKRIASDLHDGLGQTLTAAHMYFIALADFQVSDPRWEELSHTTEELISKAISETRLISHNLMPSTLNRFGLGQTIKELVERHNAIGVSLRIFYQNTIGAQRYDSRVETALFRISQEIVNNTLKHSGADELRIELSEDADFLRFLAADNGRGFDTRRQKTGLGLSNLRTRVKSLNGQIEIYSEERKGTSVHIKIPKINPII